LPIPEIPKRLVDLALRKGSKDNITVQYLQYGKSTQGGLARILRWTAVAAITVALLMGLIHLFNSYLMLRF
jgi:cell division protein FtsX